MIELELPWPDRALHPNSRGHWTKIAKAKRTAKAEAHAMTLRAHDWTPIPPGKLSLHLDFYPPDRRRRDDDGLLASMKAARDGIALALNIDDNRFVSHPRVMDKVIKGGLVRVRIVPEGV